MTGSTAAHGRLQSGPEILRFRAFAGPLTEAGEADDER